MAFLFPANPADGDLVVRGDLLATYHADTNTWTVGQLNPVAGIPGPVGPAGPSGPVAGPSGPVEELDEQPEEQSEDDGVTVDEDGTEWWEDPDDGTWYYRTQDMDDWEPFEE